MGKSAEAPAAPDYAKLIPQQNAANQKAFNYQLASSRVNSSTPFGSVSWANNPTFDQSGYDTAYADWAKKRAGSTDDYAGGEYIGVAPTKADFTTPGWSMQQALPQGQQAILDALVKQGQNNLGSSPDVSSLPPGYGQDVADAMYGRATRYLEPAWKQQQSGLEARLAEQGFVPGTPAYAQAMGNFQQGNDQARQQAADSAVVAGSQLGGAERQRALSEMLTLRDLPFNEYNQLRSGQPTAQQQYSSPSLQTPDLMGAADKTYQGQLNSYNADVAGDNQLWGTALQLGGLVAGLPMAGGGSLGGMGLGSLFGLGGAASAGGAAGGLAGGAGLIYPWMK